MGEVRYVSAILYGMAAAHGAGLILQGVGTFVCVALGTVAALFAVEHIVKDALRA